MITGIARRPAARRQSHKVALMVPLGPGEVMTGWISCDDIETLYDDEVRADAGAVTAPTMRRVEAGLRAALGMAD